MVDVPVRRRMIRKEIKFDATPGEFGVKGRQSTGRFYDATAEVSFDVEKVEAAANALSARRMQMRKDAHGKHGQAWKTDLANAIKAIRGEGPSEHHHTEAKVIFK